MPVEIPDAIPFEPDDEHNSYDPAAAHGSGSRSCRSHRVFNFFRARFLGKCSPVHFFWGSSTRGDALLRPRRAANPAAAPNVGSG